MPDPKFDLQRELKRERVGNVKNNSATLAAYSHDASIFEVRPQAVVQPQNTHQLQKLVKFVADHKRDHPELSLTARSAGTDMSGGAVNDSIIVSMEKFSHVEPTHNATVWAEPGVFYRDFEKKTLREGLLMPSYPASR